LSVLSRLMILGVPSIVTPPGGHAT
jgi:hypothetical protein